MNSLELIVTAKAIVAEDKGLLAIDESNPTCNKRFARLGIPQTEEARRAYRELILTTPGLGECISGVILYDETIRQQKKDGTTFVKVITDAGIIPGIKVDTGAKDMAGHPGEKITEGLDGLRDRLAEYFQMGARFAKWRAVINIADGIPSRGCIEANAQELARYAASCQEAGMVPVVEPVRQTNHPTKLSWPLSMRSLMVVWNALYLKKGEYADDPNKSVSWNRGAYLVQGLGHCGGCHTPRGVLGQEKAESEKDGRQYLSGAKLDNWYALPLAGDRKTGLNAWSNDEIVKYLRTGRTERVAAVGMMAGVVAKSTQYLTDQDLTAIAQYLKSLSPSKDEGQGNADSTMQTSKDDATTRALSAGDTGMRGSRVYLDNCNACHRSDGTGAKRTFPNLVRNEAVNAEDPISLIHIVLAGGAMPSTQTAPSAFAMPAFGWRLSDDEVADVLSFIRGNWGNHAAAVSPDEITRVRKALADK